MRGRRGKGDGGRGRGQGKGVLEVGGRGRGKGVLEVAGKGEGEARRPVAVPKSCSLGCGNGFPCHKDTLVVNKRKAPVLSVPSRFYLLSIYLRNTVGLIYSFQAVRIS